MKYSLGAARDYEGRGIGLLAGASYVVGSWDDDELRMLEKQDFAELHWNPACRLIVVNGPNKKLVIRFGIVDTSEKFIRLKEPLKRPVHASVALLRAKVHDPVEFIFQHIADPVRRGHKVAKGFERVGLLIGDETKPYSSLLSIDGSKLIATDIEPRVAGPTGAEATVIKPVKDEEAQRVREHFKAVLPEARFVFESPYTTNTQLAFVDSSA
ncbi:MAG: hypothetical protein H0U23_09130 [Blastocatellia bacterium]|nr:hypothetical protein [Blastocatellia bacterium]